uniref:Uncharacterized protein n=1 Tax=Plectus sambesii TaxID=2011161 RepID=A0A914X3K0_9BILA
MSTERESMTLLHSIESAQDFKKAMDILEKDMPNSANTFTSMKFWCEGTTTSIIHRFFAYPWPDPVCFMAIRFNNHIDVPSIFFHAKNGKDRQE